MNLSKILELKPDNVAQLDYPQNFDLSKLDLLSGQRVRVDAPNFLLLNGYQFKAQQPPLSVGERGIIEVTGQQIILHYGKEQLESQPLREKLQRYREASTGKKILMLILNFFN